jgi:hypothetical protein
VKAAWPGVVARLGGALGNNLARLVPHALPDPRTIAVAVPPTHAFAADACESGDAPAKIEAALRTAFGRALCLRFDRPAARPEPPRREAPTSTRALKHPDLDEDPLVQDVLRVFEARPVRVETEDESTPT